MAVTHKSESMYFWGMVKCRLGKVKLLTGYLGQKIFEVDSDMVIQLVLISNWANSNMTSWFYRQGLSAWKFSSWEAFLLENFQVEKHLSLTVFKLRSYSAWKFLSENTFFAQLKLSLTIFNWQVLTCSTWKFSSWKSKTVN